MKDLQQIPLFAALPQKELAYLSDTLRRVEYPPDTLLCKEGDPGDRFFVLLDGEVEIIKALGTADERLLNHWGPGDFFGEMSLLDPNQTRSASVRTRTEACVLEMSRQDFNALMARQPALAVEILRVLSLRLRASDNSLITDLQEKNRQLAQAYEDLKAAQAQLIEKERLERELEVAKQIQESLLPHTLPSLPGFDFGAQMIPARAVGGDFFDFIKLEDDKVGIVIGDVSDKGVPAAIFMALTHSLVRAEAQRSASPGEALRRVNGHIQDMNATGMFVTMVYGVLETHTGEFTYARAGHELPLLYGSDGAEIKTAQGQGQPLGMFPEPLLDQQTLTIPPGGMLLMYTDGVTDAMNAAENFFGLARLKEKVQASLKTSAPEMCRQVIGAVSDFQGAHLRFDDLTLVAVRAG